MLDNGEEAMSHNKMTRFTVKSVEQRYVYTQYKPEEPIRNAANYVVKYYKPSTGCMKDYFFARFPFFDWIRTYSIQDNLAKDLIAGITVREGFMFNVYFRHTFMHSQD